MSGDLSQKPKAQLDAEFSELYRTHLRDVYSYAYYRVGLSHFNDIPSVHARDLTPAAQAEKSLKEYVYRFPNDGNVADAKTKLEQCRKILAEKEMYIARFYYKRDMYEAARGRFQKILNLYPDTTYVEEAKDRLAKIEKFQEEEREEASRKEAKEAKEKTP